MRILITAGPTREHFDPVRFISNRSSGKMGYAVATAALERNHEVILVSGPVSIEPPAGIVPVRIISAEEMLNAVKSNVIECDALVMTAAVCDMRPVSSAPVKLKKSAMSTELLLEKTPDILSGISGIKGDRIFVGFAAETGNPESEAIRKLIDKNLDMIVGNDVSRSDAGFDSDDNCVTFFFRDGTKRDLPLMPKLDVGREIIKCLESFE